MLKKLLTLTKILVIEDQKILREEIIDILNLERFQAIEAENGRIGLELARTYKPDLILCDVIMPGLDGHEVLKELRQDPATATIPFIFLTAMSKKSALRQAMKLGADDYLTKPFTRGELLEAIAAQFRKQEAVDQQMRQKLEGLRTNITLSLPHELHTPLAGIIGMSELLMEEYASLDPAEALDMLDTIHSSAQRLYRLTQNFLLYAELELIMADPERVEVLRSNWSSCDATVTVTEGAMYKAQKAGRVADLKLELQPGKVAISELKLRKIIEEVVDNAFKFSDAGTPVLITSEQNSDAFIFYVIDYGRGMTAEQIANIGAYMQFERRMHEQQGSGLGLIIAQRLTELHGGELVIESTVGKQTIVQIVLQAVKES